MAFRFELDNTGTSLMNSLQCHGVFIDKQHDHDVAFISAEGRLKRTEQIPDFLQKLRERAASFGDLTVEDLALAQVIEYRPGAAIGWHRDRDVFGDIVGVSLLSPCNFRFRRKARSMWERYSLTAEPRSIYLLREPSRTEWQHSIPAVDTLRYSIIFRSLR